MRYEILGPLRIFDGAEYSFISARKIETLLAVLLIRADQVVTPDQLMTEIWGERPPRRATAGIHVYISQLRKFLHRSHHSDNPIITQPSGYLLRKGADEVDFHLFLQLVNQGHTLSKEDRYEDAATCYENALDLWHGTVLGGLYNGPIVDGFVTWLMETRMECMEMLAEAQLQLGRHRELVGRLYSLAAENPLREAFYRQLMLALYRSERQADALKVYQMARKTLNDELGLEPCRMLRELQRAILADDDRLDLLAV